MRDLAERWRSDERQATMRKKRYHSKGRTEALQTAKATRME